MEARDLVGRYPLLYHMAEDGSWPSIRRHGLLSTSALLDRCRVSGPLRREIESKIRPGSRTVSREGFGTAVIRDQRPLIMANLEKVLDGMSVGQYCRLLNGKTFFWVTEARLNRLLGARLYKDKPHDVLTVDTRKLVRDCLDRITLSPINSGTVISQNGRRGRDTFRSIADYPFEERRRKRPDEPLVELAVDYEVRDIQRHVVRVERRHGPKILETVWERRGRRPAADNDGPASGQVPNGK